MITNEAKGTFVFTSRKMSEEKSNQKNVDLLSAALVGTYASDGKSVKILSVNIEHYKHRDPKEAQIKVKFHVTTIHPKLGMDMLVDIALARTQDLIAEAFSRNDIEYSTVLADF